MLQTWTLKYNFLTAHNTNDHFVVRGPMLDMLKFTLKTYKLLRVGRYKKASVACIFKQNAGF